MTKVEYRIVEHDGGWAYKLDDVFSETHPTRASAVKAARRAAHEQQLPGADVGIIYEDANGVWHAEVSDGDDRPTASVVE
jgi:hypothetical protein